MSLYFYLVYRKTHNGIHPMKISMKEMLHHELVRHFDIRESYYWSIPCHKSPHHRRHYLRLI